MKRTRKKKAEVTLEKIEVSFKCSNYKDGEIQVVVVSPQEFSGHEAECELCGSHSSVVANFIKCGCGETHDIEINSD